MKHNIHDSDLRKAIFKAFNGKCFYTGQVIDESDMVIDHVVPKNRGGEDSVFNYVLTTRLLNANKTDTLDEDKVKPLLYLVETIYAPKVIKILHKKIEMKRKKLISDKKNIEKEKNKAYMPRKIIYIQNEEVWSKVRKRSKDAGKSISQFLLDGDNESEVIGILKRIEDKVTQILGEKEVLKKELIESQKKLEKRLESEPIKSDKVILKETLEDKVFEPEKLVEKAIKLKAEKKTPIQGSFFNPMPKKS